MASFLHFSLSFLFIKVDLIPILDQLVEMVQTNVDYSLYLVTGRELLPPGVDYYESLEASIRDGGVTIVQLREKSVETSEFLNIAVKSLEICDKVRVIVKE